MPTPIRIHTQVLPGHRIEVSTPQLSEGAAVDVLVTPSEPPAHAATDRQAILRMSVEQRRRLLSEQSDRLTEYYESSPDRSEWQGGDIVE